MPQNRDDNARGHPRDSRYTDSRNESLYGDTPDFFRGIFDSYASFLKDYYGDRGRISSGAPDINSAIEFAQELQRHPVEGAEGPPTDASGPPTGEATHTLEGDPRPEDPETHWIDPEPVHERPTNFDGSEIEGRNY